MPIYETDKQLSEYTEFHNADEYYGVPNFLQALAQLAIKAVGNKPTNKVLDLGCATGRAAFELARHFQKSGAFSDTRKKENFSTACLKSPFGSASLDEKDMLDY